MKVQHQQIRQQNMNQQEFVTSQLRQVKSRVSDKLFIMKNETNVQLLELKKRMKKRLIEKFITIKKNLVQVKIDIESIRQNIKDDKKMIEKRLIQIKTKAVFDKNELHEKIDDFSIDVKNLVVITRNDRLRRFHEVISRVKVRKSVFDFDKFT
jgi:seryl-tRNA synthetase